MVTAVDKSTGEVVDAKLVQVQFYPGSLVFKAEYDHDIKKLITTITVKAALEPDVLRRLVTLQTIPTQVSIEATQFAFPGV